MLVQDKEGREIELSVCGKYDDDIQIDDAFYADDDSEVADETIDWIQDQYASEIYDEWYQNRIGAAEAAYDSLMDR
jgi:hypothetical protein